MVFRAGKYIDPVNGETIPAIAARTIILNFSDLEKTEKRLSECDEIGFGVLPSISTAVSGLS